MQRLCLLFLGLGTFLLPTLAAAESFTTLNLRQGQTNAKWEVFRNIGVERKADGLLLTATSETGILVTDISLSDIPNAATGYDGFPQVVALVTDAATPQHIEFGWRAAGELEDQYASMPVTVGAGTDIATYVVLHRSAEWHPTITRISIILPPGASILLKEVTFIRWSMMEQMTTALLSLLSFDEYRMYAINFVWGPQIAWTPVQRSLIWNTLPPSSTSGMYVFNILLVLGLIVIFWFAFRSHDDAAAKRKLFLKRGAILLLTAWVIVDVRMGAELLTWFTRDLRSYVMAPQGARVLRDFDTFFDFAAFTAPLVADRPSYVLFTPRAYPDVPQMRYYTYPSIPGENTKDDTWVVYGRSDIAVVDNRIVIDGQTVTGPGEVLGRFDDLSFVFRINQ